MNSDIKLKLEAFNIIDPTKMDTRPEPASISGHITQRDHGAVVLFTVDRLARSPRTTVRRRTSKKAPDP